MTKIFMQNSNSHKRVELWVKSIIDFRTFGSHFPCTTSAKTLEHVRACAAGDGAICSKKIEKLSHIMGTTPILEMARAYGLRPQLWFLLGFRREKIFLDALKSMSVRSCRPVFSSKLGTRPRTEIFLFLGSPLHC